MFFFVFLLILLHLAQAQANDNPCNFGTILRKVNNKYYDCLQSGSRWRLAQCLLQRNTLEKTMQCSGWAQSRVISFDISNRPNAKDNDIVPSLNVYDTKHRAWHMLSWYGSSNDQRLDFTPRGLIVTAAAMCVNKKICGREFFTHVMQCPYEDMEQFIPCIHCYGVKETHIDDFERFIMNYKFGAADYADEKTPMQWSKYADNTCCATQLEIDDDDDDDSRFKEGKRTCQVLMAKDNGKSRHYRYTFTQTVDYRNDEAPTPKIPSDAGTRYEDETGPVPTAISATTRALDHREISSTTASPSENITSKQAINNVKILGVLSAVLNLLYGLREN